MVEIRGALSVVAPGTPGVKDDGGLTFVLVMDNGPSGFCEVRRVVDNGGVDVLSCEEAKRVNASRQQTAAWSDNLIMTTSTTVRFASSLQSFNRVLMMFS